MKVFRAMCDREANDMVNASHLSWVTRFKWFGVGDFTQTRVMDGTFNNSRFVPGRYSRLFEFDIDDESLIHFTKCGDRELMLDRRKYPLVKINSIREVV